MDDLDVSLDIFGQQPLLRIYTQLSLFFPVANASSHASIITTLTNGLERLSASFPWVAGQIVNEGAGEGNSGTFKIKAFEKIPRLVVKDARDDPSMPTMDAFRDANFPCAMLDESRIAPRHTIPGGPGETPSDPEPVLLIQVTFITGGLVLTVVAHHAAMDMTGQGQVMHLLSKACRNEPFTSEELSSGNLDRRTIIPFLDDSYKPGPELSNQIVKPPPPTADATSEPRPPPPPPPTCTWSYFTFSATSLAALKATATATLPPPTPFISTDDALTSHLWQSITRARLPRLPSPSPPSLLTRAVDARRHLGVAGTYPGLLQNMTYHALPLSDLALSPPGSPASALRAGVADSAALGWRTRALATAMGRARDRAGFSFTATVEPGRDLMVSSWAGVGCFGMDFGLGLGGPEAVRRPRFVPVEGLVYLMPRAPDGEIAVMVCLRDEDMERLRADGEFGRYARYVG
ncbi:transferase family-domain-containing protein [Phialemonium atrogriseum]|uniref:Transferase family-domain-containing protein n=1 Tax=Phialemonium atrogriseum TaxID=1093897 RepID=A0AAJ0BXX8_9PEZI|nr:transferase family-domain-containing protein [Phialemonium atrogriseum]KAK1765438.1 transferase family-domain-containing protein [Phialemonium atrogriseum]